MSIGGRLQNVTHFAGYDPIESDESKGSTFYFPGGVFEWKGQVYIADSGHHRIKKRDIYGNVFTIAGTGIAGYSGDNDLAINAQLNFPQSIYVIDDMIFIADTNNHVIRSIDSHGVIRTIAGNGIRGYSGDGELATDSQLNFPQSVCEYDREIYIADTNNNRIRRVDQDGFIWTMAGTGELGIMGDGGLATNAQLMYPRSIQVNKDGIVQFTDEGIRMIDSNGMLKTIVPVHSSTKSGRVLFITDKNQIGTWNSVYVHTNGDIYCVSGNEIRRIDSNNTMTTIAGGAIGGYSGDGDFATQAQFNHPSCVFVFTNGNIYIADTNNHRIRMIDTNGNISTIAGVGEEGYSGDGDLAIYAMLSNPTFVFVDSDEQIYITDGNRVRKIDTNGIITTIAGTGSELFNGDGLLATDTNLARPSSVMVHNSEVYILDSNHRIRKIQTNGTIMTVAGTGETGYDGDGGLAIHAKIIAHNMFVHESGEIYIADMSRIRKIDLSGVIRTVAGTGTCCDDYYLDGISALNAQLFHPSIYVQGNGDIYIADSDRAIREVEFKATTLSAFMFNNQLYQTVIDGVYAPMYHSAFLMDITPKTGQVMIGNVTLNITVSIPSSIYVSDDYIIHIADSFEHKVIIVNGTNTTELSGRSTISNPKYLIVHDGEVYYLEEHLVRKVDRNGMSMTVCGQDRGYDGYTFSENGYVGDLLAIEDKLDNPQSFYIYNNEIYIADTFNDRIRKIETSGVLKTISGTGGFSFGDASLAINALLQRPTGIFVDYNGDVYIVDTGFNVIRKILLDGTIITIAGKIGCKGYSVDGMLATETCFNTPTSVYVHNSEIYITDSGNHLIRKVDTLGYVSTIAGRYGFSGYNGDNVFASTVVLNNPTTIIVHKSGAIYFSDYNNNRIRRIDLHGYIHTFIEDVKVFTIDTSSDSVFFFKNGMILQTETCLEGHCEIITCDGLLPNNTNICHGRGECVETNTCNCTDGYDGTFCQYTSCYGKPSNDLLACNGNGNCTSLDTCACKLGYYGLECEYPSCYGIVKTNDSVCSGHGTCSGLDTCHCHSNYTGARCQKFTCQSCPIHSTCIEPLGCVCTNGYGGSHCEYSLCDGILSNNHTVCNGHGNCTLPNTCKCMNGYYGSKCQYYTCHGVQYSNTSVCNHRGNCTDMNTCTCSHGYTGKACELSICNGITNDNKSVCSGHGTCNNQKCTCNSTFSGDNCQYPVCYGVISNNQTVCSAHGSCIAPNSCKCNTGYNGLKCDTPICYGKSNNTCSDHGKCSDPDTCTCNSGYIGLECELALCYTIPSNDQSVCTGHGSCTAPNTCKCNDGYYGSNCNNAICYDIPSNNQSVCNGHGQCIEHNTCVCQDEYIGSHCNISTCYGISEFNESVCNGHGICKGGKCACLDNYYGNECEIISCFGYNSSHSAQVCNGNGQCQSPNNCTCYDGYFGYECQHPSCYNYAHFSPLVCNHGNGTCISKDTCECNDGFMGLDCSDFACFNISKDDEQVCNFGKCLLPDTCSCREGYYGEKCQFESIHVANVIGSEHAGYNGENVTATRAVVNHPTGIQYLNGELYFSDTNNHRIRKISNGVVKTIAGNGVSGYNGDDILATHAQLNYPHGIHVFNSEIFIADSLNQKIRKVLTNGTIITIVGNTPHTPLFYPQSVFVHPQTEEVYFSDTSIHCVRKITRDGTMINVAGNGNAGYNDYPNGHLATESMLNNPTTIFIDNQVLFIVDQGNNLIRSVSLITNIMTTVAGSRIIGDRVLTTSASLNKPMAVFAFDNEIYFSGKINRI